MAATVCCEQRPQPNIQPGVLTPAAAAAQRRRRQRAAAAAAATCGGGSGGGGGDGAEIHYNSISNIIYCSPHDRCIATPKLVMLLLQLLG